MAASLIELEDNITVEVDTPEDEQISGGFARRVESKLDIIRPILLKVSRTISDTWKDMDRHADVEQAEIHFGLSFGAEGNVYVTKSTIGANLSVKLVIKPKKV